MDDPYITLGVSRESSHDDIKRAFHRLAHKYHPDKQGGDEAMMKKVSGAYAFLKSAHIQRPKAAPNNTNPNAPPAGKKVFYEYDQETGRWYSWLDLDRDGFVQPTVVVEQTPEEFAELVRQKKGSRIGHKPEPYNAAREFKKKHGMS